MIAVDTNILIYAHRKDAPAHTRAKHAVERLLGGGGQVLLPLHCAVEFYAVVTGRGMKGQSTPPLAAIAFLESLLGLPNVLLGTDTPNTWARFVTLLRENNISGAHTHDARIAAVCIDYAVEALWSTDRQLSDIPQLKVVNPLV
jgi:toxin-antitoxin system PIN domain toxin